MRKSAKEKTSYKFSIGARYVIERSSRSFTWNGVWNTTLSDPDKAKMSNEEIQAVAEWYRRVPEEMKRYVAFRYERMKDESVAEICEVFSAAEKLSKGARRASKS